MALRKAVFIFASAAFLGGCAAGVWKSPWNCFNEKRIIELRKGETTRKEAISIFGSPQIIERDQAGKEYLHYYFSIQKNDNSFPVPIPIIEAFFESDRGRGITKYLMIVIRNDVVIDFSYKVTEYQF